MYWKTILVTALVLRLGVVWMVLCRYPRSWLLSQAPDLGFLAKSLSSGHGLSSPFGGSTGPTAFLAPGYPAVLGAIFYFFGSYSLTSDVLMMTLQMGFAVLTVALIMRVAYQICGAPTANLAGACWAGSPPLLWLPAVRWDTGLSALLLLGMVGAALSKPGKALWANLGAYGGLAMLINPSLMLPFFAITAWVAYQAKSEWRQQAWMCPLVFLAVFAGWPIRNAIVLHAFVPLRSNFGYELWQGNHVGGNGYFEPTLEPLQNRQEYSDYARQGEMLYMRNKSELAEMYIRVHPGEFLAVSAKRVARFWTGTGSREQSGFTELHAILTSMLGLLGLAALFRQRSTYSRSIAMLFLLPLLLFPLPYYITHPDFRFRLLLDPLLTILTAFAVVRFHSDWSAAHDQRHKRFSSFCFR